MRWYIRWSNCFWRTKTDKPLTRPNKSRRPSKVQNRFSSTHSTRSQLKRGLKDVFSIFPYFVTGIRFKNGRDCTFSFHFAPKKSCRERRRLESTLPSVSFFAWCFALHQLLLTFCHTNQRVLLAYLRVWKKRRQKCWGLHWLSQKSSTSKHKKERGRENYIITRYCFLFFRGLFLADVTGIVLRLKHVVYTSCIFDTISKQYWSWQCQCNRWPSGPLA